MDLSINYQHGCIKYTAQEDGECLIVKLCVLKTCKWRYAKIDTRWGLPHCAIIYNCNGLVNWPVEAVDCVIYDLLEEIGSGEEKSTVALTAGPLYSYRAQYVYTLIYVYKKYMSQYIYV